MLFRLRLLQSWNFGKFSYIQDRQPRTILILKFIFRYVVAS
jgi:hypothetical protein